MKYLILTCLKMSTAHILYDPVSLLSLSFWWTCSAYLLVLSRGARLMGDVVLWGHYRCQLCPKPLTSVTLTYVYISQMWESTLGQKPCLSPHTSHDHSLIYSHLPQPLIDGSHLINAIAVQGLLAYPICTPSLAQAAALQLKDPWKPTVLQRKRNGPYHSYDFAALILFEKAEQKM